MEKMKPVSVAPVIKKVKFSPSRSVSKNTSLKNGTGDVMNGISWRVQAESLFFVDKKIFIEISQIVGISAKSISNYLKNLPGYEDEVEIRKEIKKQKKLEYQRELKRKQRAENARKLEEEKSIKREHEIAVKVLSSDKYF